MEAAFTSEIIEKAKNSADLAADICVQYKNLVKGIARKYFLACGDEDDLLQEGMIGLYKAISKYDKSKGAFSTFATLCIKSEIISAIRRSTAQKNSAIGISIEGENLGDVLPSSVSEFDILAQSSEYDLRLRKIKEVLSVKENQVLTFYLEGLSYAQMAAKLGTNIKSIENAIKRVKKKLKEKTWHI